jgi:glycerol uptake facilitator-like aquaporin
VLLGRPGVRGPLLLTPTLPRRATAEALGTGLLVAVVVGSGIAAERLSPDDVGLQLLENTLATAGGLVALILAFGPISGAHLNPVVTFALGTRPRDAWAYVAAQVGGACLGAVVANLMFDLDAVTLSTNERSSAGIWLAEVVATFGLVLLVAGLVRTAQLAVVPFAVAGWITAAYWFTSSTSFANPAVTIGRTLSDTFAGIDPGSAPAFVLAQALGAALAVAAARWLHGGPS